MRLLQPLMHLCGIDLLRLYFLYFSLTFARAGVGVRIDDGVVR